MNSMYKGRISLKRKDADFKAGFCLLYKNLSELVAEISMLHSDELSYYDTLKFDKRKTSYLLGRIAAKNALSEILIRDQDIQSIAIEFGVFRFPVVKHLKDQNIQVSISHTDDCGIAIAFQEEHPLGIDIEEINEQKNEVIKNVLIDKELELIENNDVPLLIAFPILWTIKEGLSKILKTGLTIDFNILEVDTIKKVEDVYISSFRHFVQYKAVSFQIHNHICSMVLPKNSSFDVHALKTAFEARK